MNETDGSQGALQIKPMLATEQQIAHLKRKGVTFDFCSEKEAAEYLSMANNYLRAASYRKLYPVRAEGLRKGEYIGLDFEALRRLSSADRVLRSALREIVLDVEHFARVRLINRALAEGEDGYGIVADYLGGLSAHDRLRIEGGFDRRGSAGRTHDEYSGDLIAHCAGRYPLWVFLEVVEFGRFCDLWLFCSRRWDDRSMLDLHYVLKSVKALRNGVCHNSCIINGLSSAAEQAGFSTPGPILASMNKGGIGNTKARRAKMSNLRVAQMAAALYASCELCPTDSARIRHAAAMDGVRRAFDQVRPLCPADGSLSSFFDFVMKLVDIWMPKRA